MDKTQSSYSITSFSFKIHLLESFFDFKMDSIENLDVFNKMIEILLT